MEATNKKVGARLEKPKPKPEIVENPNGDHRKKYALVSDGNGGIKQIER